MVMGSFRYASFYYYKTMISFTKRYIDLPFAHRQPHHNGHCAMIHGHSWGIEFEFTAQRWDECGFVVDFGSLKWLKEWIDAMFDHTLVLNADDPYLKSFQIALEGTANIKVVPDCSSEGLAIFIFQTVADLLWKTEQGRVSLLRVTVFEDSKNSATYK